MCLFIIQMLLLKPSEFKTRALEFVSENSPEHWKQSNWHEKHMAFLRVFNPVKKFCRKVSLLNSFLFQKFPEKFYFENLQDISAQSSQHVYLPLYFSNVVLRLLPVLDIVIHRFLELPPGSMSLETLLDSLGSVTFFKKIISGSFLFLQGVCTSFMIDQ